VQYINIGKHDIVAAPIASLHINITMASAKRLAEQLVQDYWYVS